jgi:hypothetical protein
MYGGEGVPFSENYYSLHVTIIGFVYKGYIHEEMQVPIPGDHPVRFGITSSSL